MPVVGGLLGDTPLRAYAENALPSLLGPKRQTTSSCLAGFGTGTLGQSLFRTRPYNVVWRTADQQFGEFRYLVQPPKDMESFHLYQLVCTSCLNRVNG
uniref:Uncharacterized protein n=1 Tax=Trichuris muris TaxID=70415 RepID=A0A5S6Q4P3_TRIMR